MSGADSAHSDYVGSLFHTHYPWLCGRLHRHLNSRAHAEDIAVDAFVQLLSAPQVAPIRQPRALPTTIAQRLVCQVWRRRDLERAYLAALDDDAACTEDWAQRSVSDYMARAVTGLESHTDHMWELACLR